MSLEPTPAAQQRRPEHSTRAARGPALAAAAWSVVLAPAAILLHELGAPAIAVKHAAFRREYLGPWWMPRAI